MLMFQTTCNTMSCFRVKHNLLDWESSFIKPNFPLSQKISISNPTKRLLKSSTKINKNKSFNCCSFVGPLITSCLQSNFPILSDYSFSQKDDDHEKSSEGLPSIAGGIVALGKFEALHVGHRELAIQASRAGTPFLLSFVGMAEVFGWAPRVPIVAKCDRDRILSSWAPLCGNTIPKEFQIDFVGVRHLTPREFVEKLAKELGVRGVVAGENYRFGYKASGDASELVKLCDEYGMHAYIISSVMDKNQGLDNVYPRDNKERGQISSTRVRYALSKGDMNYVSELLGRQHRVLLSTENMEYFDGSKKYLCAPKSCLLNLPPKEGLYENCSLIVGEEDHLSCTLLIDSAHIHLELGEKDHYIHDVIEDLDRLGIEVRG